MKITAHSDRDFADAIQALLPEGAAWDYAEGSFGDSMFLGTAQELPRVEGGAQAVLDHAIELHRPKVGSWHISKYREVAQAALGGITETMPRRMFGAGSHAGERLWSVNAPAEMFPVELVKVDHLIGPFRAGSHAGDGLWGTRSRYVMRVRYYRSVVDPAPIYAALAAFKQAHVYLWFEDITGVGGSYAPN